MNSNRNLMIGILVLGVAILGVGIYSVVTKSPEAVSIRPTNISSPESKQITVPANQTWIDTGIQVQSGQTLNITASGQVIWKDIAKTNPNAYPKAYEECSPNGTPPTDSKDYYSNISSYQSRQAYKGALIGKFGSSGTPFPIGTSFSKAMNESGTLFLGINEMRPDVDTTAYNDNSGSFNVQIQVK